MVFSSTVFLFVFLPLVLAVYYLLDRRFKNTFLLLASLVFYAWGEPKFVVVMLFSILVNYIFGLLASRTGSKGYRRSVLALAAAFNIGLFFVFKYLNFTIYNLNKLMGGEYLSQTEIALPIGISFFTFQAMSYVFDVAQGRGRVQKNPLDVALYIALFPQLIAGPIVRYETIAAEIKCRRETLEDFAEGIRRFICGFAKKAILANSLAVLADQAFRISGFEELSVSMAWLGAVSYTLQIYYDFSGYSDMAIGLGRMFGFHFEENFRYSYMADSVSEFWRRWHISLGSWFRDYVYFPLGGSRVKSRWKLLRNLFAVWLLTGIWHGAAWSFVAWGLMYFILILFEKLTGYPGKLKNDGLRLLYRLFTLLTVSCGWVIFRAEGLKNGLKYLGCMFGLMGNAVFDVAGVYLWSVSLVLLWISVLLCIPVFPWLRRVLGGKTFAGWKAVVSPLLYMILFVAAASFTVTSSYNPFIYFNF